jgi:Leu/Phe-tRNA-protein transferase
VTRDKARAYAAVAIDEDGRVIDTWFSALPHVALIGAMEVLKNDYLNELYGEKTDE